jgi:hypothetical protein
MRGVAALRVTAPPQEAKATQPAARTRRPIDQTSPRSIVGGGGGVGGSLGIPRNRKKPIERECGVF